MTPQPLSLCDWPGCNKPARHPRGGLCSMHLGRKHRSADMNAPQMRLTKGTPKPPCSVDGCDGSATRRGWCRTHYERWKRHGDPLVFLNDPRPASERFWEKVDKSAGPDGCWLWTGHLNRQGYGRFEGTTANRWAYQDAHGPVDASLHTDHLCRNRPCVNPAHIEPVTPGENARRGLAGEWNRVKTHCPMGHPYSPENTYVNPTTGGRTCIECRKGYSRNYRARKAGRAA